MDRFCKYCLIFIILKSQPKHSAFNYDDGKLEKVYLCVKYRTYKR